MLVYIFYKFAYVQLKQSFVCSAKIIHPPNMRNQSIVKIAQVLLSKDYTFTYTDAKCKIFDDAHFLTFFSKRMISICFLMLLLYFPL